MPKNSKSGILVHITSLPCSFGTGDFGPSAEKFIKQLQESSQSFWQILPINYPDYSASPYSSLSAFAGNPFLISPEKLYEKGLLQHEILKDTESFIQENSTNEKMDFELIKKVKTPLLRLAFEKFKGHDQEDFEKFQKEESFWLSKFCIYISLSLTYGEKWWKWPLNIKNIFERHPVLNSKEDFDYLLNDLKEQVQDENFQDEFEFQKWLQFEFAQQWDHLKSYAHHSGIQIIGDIPIFVSHRSQDVWSWQDGFQVTSEGFLKSEAGVPPDQFSQTGQKWSMPTYNWPAHQASNFKWWRERIRKQFAYYDLVRLDHFIGFHHLFNIPPKDETAANGKWVETPGDQMLELFLKDYGASEQSPFIAEDLGEITPEVNLLRDKFKIPSMKVFQFGYWSDTPNDHHPKNIKPDSVYYTGTHDTNTLKGWLDELNQDDEGKKLEKKRVEDYFRKPLKDLTPFDFISQALQTPSNLVIIPLQDLFFLDKSHRFNIPGTEKDNWIWRITDTELYHKETWSKLKEISERSIE